MDHQGDECLGEAWKVVSLDPFTSANQSAESYWLRVKGAYDERRNIDREFAVCVHDRNPSAMSHRWAMVQHACNKWLGIQEKIRRKPESGTNINDQVRETTEFC